MKISVINKRYQRLFDWLNETCHVRGRKVLKMTGKCKIWHGDVLPSNADRGDRMYVYEIELSDNCQDHISDFSKIQKLVDGNQYIICVGAVEKNVDCSTL